MAHLRSYVDRDVTVMVEAGGGRQGKDISLAVFQDWLRGSLDIRGFSYPTHILETNAGDLILDPQFQGCVYLKGMLLPATICKLQPYKLAYNFPRGRVNRDRQMLVDSQEEAGIVRQIWEAAFESHEKALLPIYINLLRNFPEAPDVGFADRLQRSTKSLIWKHLLREADGKGFYYSQTSNAQSIEMIRTILQKEPMRIPETLWNILRSISPIRTPEEEQIECFGNSEAHQKHASHGPWKEHLKRA